MAARNLDTILADLTSVYRDACDQALAAYRLGDTHECDMWDELATRIRQALLFAKTTTEEHHRGIVR